MKPAKLFIFGLALGISSHAALAFQEQGGKAPAQGQAAPAGSVTPPPASGLPRTGTEIRIPGLGPVGTLPKFDFGLELLYGAGEQRSVEPPSKSEPSEVQIRGTIKYKFNN
jgi:hypothetical protein